MNPYIVPTLDSLRAGGVGKPQPVPAAPRQLMPGTLLPNDTSLLHPPCHAGEYEFCEREFDPGDLESTSCRQRQAFAHGVPSGPLYRANVSSCQYLGLKASLSADSAPFTEVNEKVLLRLRTHLPCHRRRCRSRAGDSRGGHQRLCISGEEDSNPDWPQTFVAAGQR